MTEYTYEITDTFGGEANYCWVRRGTVKARSMRGAIRAAKSQQGLLMRHDKDYDDGLNARVNFRGWLACMFISVAGV